MKSEAGMPGVGKWLKKINIERPTSNVEVEKMKEQKFLFKS